MFKKSPGFTIVELLIVIVVVAILATIAIVAYNGIQARARDSERQTEMQTIEKALSLYFIDNGSYPTCSNTTYVPTSAPGGCNFTVIAPSLVPKYLNIMPIDPSNSGNDKYMYAYGFKKTGATGYTGDASNNYISGMHLETMTGNINPGWTSPAYYNYLGGSSN